MCITVHATKHSSTVLDALQRASRYWNVPWDLTKKNLNADVTIGSASD